MEKETFQMALHFGLRYFLVDSFTNSSLRKNIIERVFLPTHPLVPVLKMSAMGRNRVVSLPRILTVRSYAKILSKAFALWEEHVSYYSDGNVLKLPKSGSYKEWLKSGGYKKRYEVVHILQKKLCKVGRKVFCRAILHGSVATLDDVEGFSDIDLTFIVQTRVLKNPDSLLFLRKLSAQILALTLTFDPFMHHGPLYIPEIDLKWYPEALFPLVLYKHGVDLLNTPNDLYINVRPSEEFTDQQIEMFEKFFKNWPSNPFSLKDGYELEWVLGSVLLLPALYLQKKTKIYRYKRDTFSLAQKDFTSQEWEPVDSASKIRTNLSPRIKPPFWLVSLALNLEFPSLLQQWSRLHPQSVVQAKEVASLLGCNYPQRVCRFLKAMKKLQEKEVNTCSHKEIDDRKK